MSSSWRIRELVELDAILDAADAVCSWGFPRAISQPEIASGLWFRMGHGVVFWFEAFQSDAPDSAFIHLCVDPNARSRWPVRRWHIAAQVIAELMGARWLVASPCSGAILDYALRLGWRAVGEFIAYPLGGSGFGEHRSDFQQGRMEGAEESRDELL